MNTNINKILAIITNLYNNVISKYIDKHYINKGINPIHLLTNINSFVVSQDDINNGFIYNLYNIINIIGINNIDKAYVRNILINICENISNININDINKYYLYLLCEQFDTTIYKQYLNKECVNDYVYNDVLIKYLINMFISLVTSILDYNNIYDVNKCLNIVGNNYEYINVLHKNNIYHDIDNNSILNEINNVINIYINNYKEIMNDLNNIYISISNIINIQICSNTLNRINDLITLLKQCISIINDNCTNVVIKRTYEIRNEKANNDNIEINRLNNNKIFNIIYNTFIDSYSVGNKYLTTKTFIHWLFDKDFKNINDTQKHNNFIFEFIVYVYNNDYKEYCNFINNLSNDNELIMFYILFEDYIDNYNDIELDALRLLANNTELIRYYKFGCKWYFMDYTIRDTWIYKTWKDTHKQSSDNEILMQTYYMI